MSGLWVCNECVCVCVCEDRSLPLPPSLPLRLPVSVCLSVCVCLHGRPAPPRRAPRLVRVKSFVDE